ncbi:excinuclease ABC subunit UvrB [bacterium]|nr:excinuclease ABC subunit UvrB [bacterium]
MTNRFNLISDFNPAGDQPAAIEKLAQGLDDGKKYQVLMGVTGSGKTFSIAKVIEQLQRPAIVISHNKTLAAQLYSEFKDFFPDNRVEYFVSYYDYYQPEAYLPEKDMFIEKDADINQEIDRLRHSATHSVLTRRDTIIVASISCIFGLGSPDRYENKRLYLRVGDKIDRQDLLRRLVRIMYERNDIAFEQGRFRVKGDIVDIFPMYEEKAVRVELFGDEIEKISYFDPLRMEIFASVDQLMIFPARHYLIEDGSLEPILTEIKEEMEKRESLFLSQGKLLEAERIRQRVMYDLEMLQVMHYTKGVENYSRYFDGRSVGEPPMTLLDYLPEDALYIIDESHVTVPQVKGMYNGDRARKENLVEFGFRLPSAFDNRPLKYDEFWEKVSQAVFISATPANFEIEKAGGEVVEQVIRPTGLVDPEIKVFPTINQVDRLLELIQPVLKRNEKVLVTTITKKMSEELAYHLMSLNYRVKYLHSGIDTIERYNILKMLRTDVIDIIVGVNLLREGLDLPEVSLVVIFDADKPGFLRSHRSLIQTIGRTARNVNGCVVLFGDMITPAMKSAMDETARRREQQIEYNKANNIIPKTIISKIKKGLELENGKKFESDEDLDRYLKKLKKKMDELSKELKFEEAAKIRDEVLELRKNFLTFEI